MGRRYGVSTAGALALLVAAPLLVYWGSLDNAFQYDDIHSLVENQHIRSWRNIPAFFVQPELFSSEPKSAMYRPLVLVSYALNYILSEYRVGSYHWFNLWVHICNSLLVYFLLRGFTETRLTAFLIGLVFGLHPVNSETVNYISSRSESLCAFFFLGSLNLYLRARQGEGCDVGWLGGSLSAFAGALLVKSVGITLIGVLFAVEVWMKRGKDTPTLLKQMAQWQWPFWGLGGIYLVITRQLIEKALIDQPVRDFATQFYTQAKAIIYYGKLWILPVGLNVEHQFRLGSSIGDLQILLPVAILLILFAFFLKFRAAHALWLAWPFIILFPTMIIPLNVLVNEHRLYLPSVALAVLLVKALEGIVDRHRGKRMGIIVVCLFIFGILDCQRTRAWETPQTLWEDSLRKAPMMPRPHIYVGDYYKMQGEYGSALGEYETALDVYPQVLSGGDRLVIHNNMGATYLSMGRFLESIDAYQKALQIDSTYSKARESLEGVLALKKAERDPRAEKLRKRGLNRMISGDLEGAIADLRSALEIQSDPQTWMGLGIAFERNEDWPAAIRAYEILKILGEGGKYAETAEEKIRLIKDRQ